MTPMHAILVVAAVLTVFAVFAGFWAYLNILDRRIEAAEIKRIKNLTPDEQQKMLQDAKTALCVARSNFEYVHALWLNYPWGRTRNNPHYIPRFAAAMECARLRHLLGSLQKAVVAA